MYKKKTCVVDLKIYGSYNFSELNNIDFEKVVVSCVEINRQRLSFTMPKGRKKGTRCQRNGCRRHARRGGTNSNYYCQAHQEMIRYDMEQEASRKRSEKQPIGLSGNNSLLEIAADSTKRLSKKHQKWMKDMEKKVAVRDRKGRQFFRLEESEIDFLWEVYGEVKEQFLAFAGWEKDQEIEFVEPDIIFAPPEGNDGTIHRDVSIDNVKGNETELLGRLGKNAFSIFYLVEKVNESNGPCKVFLETETVPLAGEKSKSFLLKRLERDCESKLIKGEKGTVFIMDSRVLHMPCRNRTENTRWIVNWIVEKKE